MPPYETNMQTPSKYYQKPNMVSQVWSEFNVRSKWQYLSILLSDPRYRKQFDKKSVGLYSNDY